RFRSVSRYLFMAPAVTALCALALHDALPILRDVRLKRLDVAYGDEPILRYYLRVTRSKVLRLVESFKPTALEDVCLILRKDDRRSEEHTSELQSRENLVCRLLLEKKKYRDSI